MISPCSIQNVFQKFWLHRHNKNNIFHNYFSYNLDVECPMKSYELQLNKNFTSESKGHPKAMCSLLTFNVFVSWVFQLHVKPHKLLILMRDISHDFSILFKNIHILKYPSRLLVVSLTTLAASMGFPEVAFLFEGIQHNSLTGNCFPGQNSKCAVFIKHICILKGKLILYKHNFGFSLEYVLACRLFNFFR